jgi:uncharacterized membrane protein
MNYNNYNLCCFLTSIVMFIILLTFYSKIQFCYIMIISALLSIMWRGCKLYMGEKVIEGNNKKYVNNPLFMLDFLFAFVVYILVFYSNQINKKFIFLTFFIFVIAWYLQLSTNADNDYDVESQNNIELSRTMHFVGHLYVIIVFILTFYCNLCCESN